MASAIPAFLLGAVVAIIAGPARADAARDALIEIARCTDIADSSERLKCFDAAMPRAKSALAVPAPPTAKESVLDWFGLARPRKATPEPFGKPSPPPEPTEVTEITATVVEFAKTVRGQALCIVDNGQVWRQLDADSTSVRDPPPGATMKVRIERGFLGSYNLTIDGRNPLIKVFRLK